MVAMGNQLIMCDRVEGVHDICRSPLRVAQRKSKHMGDKRGATLPASVISMALVAGIRRPELKQEVLKTLDMARN